MNAPRNMTGLWLDGTGLSLRRDIPSPQRQADEALLRVGLAGICGTDLELLRGYAAFRGIPGHELVAVVEEGPAEWIGRRVVVDINLACGDCAPCRSRRPRHCARRQVLGIRGRNGAFAQRVSVPVTNLHRVPDAVSDDRAVFAEPLAAALRIEEQLAPQAASRVLVVGDGRLGILVALALDAAGHEVQVVGRHPRKLALLRVGGIGTGTEAEAGDFDVAVDCSGDPSGFDAARRALRPEGTLVIKSTRNGKTPVDLAKLVVDEIHVIGSRCGDLGRALACLAAGAVDPRPLIEAEYALEEGLEAFAHAGRSGALKILLRP